MEITKDIKYVGVNDHEIDLFEGQYIVPNGVAYNSYVIIDDKIAVMDSVDGRFHDEWLNNIEAVIKDRKPDYLIIQHMEPDHSSSILNFMEKYPEATVVAGAVAFKFMEQFYGTRAEGHNLVIKEGDVLDLGQHKLNFISAPMVHWPEVMMTFDRTDGVLFSADGFGKFGALDYDEDWACEARRYYFGIVGKYGDQVQALLKKASGLEIKTICPLHGPVLSENLGYYLNLYNTWSSYGVETEGVMIAYTSVYGHTKGAAIKLAKLLEDAGCPKVAVNDLAREDMAECVEDAFRYGKIVLATTTYNNEIYPFMNTFIDWLVERNFKNKKIGLIENGTWAPKAAKLIIKKLEDCKNIEIVEPVVTIKSALNDESSAKLEDLAKAII